MKYTRDPRRARRRRARHTISRLLFASLVAGAALLSLYTVQGLGDDIASLGQSTEEFTYVKD